MPLFAERARTRVALIASLLGAAALVAVLPHHHHHRHHHRHAAVSFDMPRCHEPHRHARPAASAPSAASAPEPPPTSYDAVLHAARSRFAACHAEASLLLTIGADGHVHAATPRPDPETAGTRCLANVASMLAFPPARTPVIMRVNVPGNLSRAGG